MAKFLKRFRYTRFNCYQTAKIILAVWLTLFASNAFAESEKLQSVHQWIEQTYPRVDHVDSEQYLSEVANSSKLVIFDVREPEEFAVSHLEGAVQVDPEISKDAFINQYAGALSGMTVVFYCSVGRRSSLLADTVSDALIDAGSGDVFNLKHGIFGWHNESKPLTRDKAITDYVHPYSWRWKRYLQRKDLARYKVE